MDVSSLSHSRSNHQSCEEATLEEASISSMASTEEDLSSLRDLTADIPHGGYVPPTPQSYTNSLSVPVIDSKTSGFTTSTPMRQGVVSTGTTVYFTPDGSPEKSIQAVTCSSSEEYYELLRTKSHLEGRLEAVMADAKAAFQEKTELKGELAKVRAELRNKSDTTHLAVSEKNVTVAELESLRKNREQLENSLESMHRALEERSGEAKLLQDNLSSAQETNNVLVSRMDELKMDMQVKYLSL